MMQLTLEVPEVELLRFLVGIAALLSFLLFSKLSFFFHRSKLHIHRHDDNTWALVTGASDGIGYGLVVELAQRGFNVIVHGRNPTKVDNLLTRLRSGFPTRRFRPWILDASDRASYHKIQDLKAQLLAERINLTVLINNVGISVFSGPNFLPLAQVDEAHVAKLIDVNIVFPTQLTRTLLPILTSKESALILNLGSAAGVFPAIYTSIYGGSKAYLFHLSKIIKNELRAEGHSGVEIMGVLVGSVQSAGTKEFVTKPSLFAPSSGRYARAVLDSVGCGKDIVNPYWPHVLQFAVPMAVPPPVLAWMVRKACVEMKAVEQRQLQERRGSGR